ncbi:MAG: ABC transporter permease, partial [Chloroflexota bacterium]
MLAYIVKRLALAAIVLLGVSVFSFTLISLVPGDPARVLAGQQATPSVLAQIRHGWGLDRPAPIRYLSYMGHVLRGDFGHSYIEDEDVLPAVLSRFPQTAELALAGLLCEMLVAFPLGTLAAA